MIELVVMLVAVLVLFAKKVDVLLKTSPRASIKFSRSVPLLSAWSILVVLVPLGTSIVKLNE